MGAWGAGFRDEAEALPLASAEGTGSTVDFQVMALRARDSRVGL
jgi:hypothetical protein